MASQGLPLRGGDTRFDAMVIKHISDTIVEIYDIGKITDDGL